MNVLPSGDYVRESLELHLFFGRIMKEHAIFLEAGFVAKDVALAQEADRFRSNFAEVLQNAVALANGVVSEEALSSGEAFTDKTLQAEQRTEQLSGIVMNSVITTEELRLCPRTGILAAHLEAQVAALNQKAIGLLHDFIQFKTAILDGMLQNRLYTTNFPLLIIHIRREAIHYLKHLERLQRRIAIPVGQGALDEELFWNRQMAEHAEFIAHLLDPMESALMLQANQFAAKYTRLEQITQGKVEGTKTLGQLTRETLTTTRAFRDFKSAGTEGILLCKIKSIIIPLLGDHVLREANHYLRLLNRSKGALQV